MLVIRRGRMGQHVSVPDTGAIIELNIKATPTLAEVIGPRLFRIVRNGDVATVTHVCQVGQSAEFSGPACPSHTTSVTHVSNERALSRVREISE
jgi:hypothetical protein